MQHDAAQGDSAVSLPIALYVIMFWSETEYY